MTVVYNKAKGGNYKGVEMLMDGVLDTVQDFQAETVEELENIVIGLQGVIEVLKKEIKNDF